jgi:hypothetical protein
LVNFAAPSAAVSGWQFGACSSVDGDTDMSGRPDDV